MSGIFLRESLTQSHHRKKVNEKTRANKLLVPFKKKERTLTSFKDIYESWFLDTT